MSQGILPNYVSDKTISTTAVRGTPSSGNSNLPYWFVQVKVLT